MVLRARKGIPHLEDVITPKGNKAPTLTEEEFKALYRHYAIEITNVTEKTDGIAWIVGYDVDGFFTMHSGSTGVRARAPHPDHIKHARDRGRTGSDLEPYGCMDAFAEALYLNHDFHDYLMYRYNTTGKDVIIRGEAFINALALETPEGMVYNRIPYNKIDTSIGMFVIHSQLEDNKEVDIDTIISFSDGSIKFDCDRYHFKPFQVLQPTAWLNLPFDFQKYMVASCIMQSLDEQVKPKWGNYREGIVVHPCSYDRPRFKIISKEFQQRQRSWQ